MFEERVRLLEGAEEARATASGMAAVNAAMLCYLKAGDHIVSARALFGACRYVVETLAPRYGITSTLIVAPRSRSIRRWRPPPSAPRSFVGPTLPGLDCFHAPGLFAREWPKLLRAYALDAYGTAAGAWDESAARSRADGLLRAAARVEGGVRGSVGAGQLFEFTLDGRRGAALLFEGLAIHLAIL